MHCCVVYRISFLTIPDDYQTSTKVVNLSKNIFSFRLSSTLSILPINQHQQVALKIIIKLKLHKQLFYSILLKLLILSFCSARQAHNNNFLNIIINLLLINNFIFIYSSPSYYTYTNSLGSFQKIQYVKNYLFPFSILVVL